MSYTRWRYETNVYIIHPTRHIAFVSNLATVLCLLRPHETIDVSRYTRKIINTAGRESVFRRKDRVKDARNEEVEER